jgi:predicted alpha/beta superfamily hydrolase
LTKINFFISVLSTCIISTSTFSQTTITGQVIDSTSKEHLPFVNIGIKHENIGTLSLRDGSFSIVIPQQYLDDSLTFSMVGYTDVQLSIQNIQISKQKIFPLKANPKELKEVTVSSKLIEKKYGIKNHKALIHFDDGSTNQNDIFEIAQLIKLDTLLSKITSVNLYMSKSRNDSGTFRINFYEYDGNRPTNRIVEKNIIQTLAIKEGWLTFDLSEYSIYLRGNFVISIEFIPTLKKTDPIFYEVKLGGPAKSFMRASSQGDWHIPPHHYRLYVTALVPATKKNMQEDTSEEFETIPLTQLYSQFVKDTFSLFVRLPKNYKSKSKQTYPVIYLLDANAYFDIVNNSIKENKFLINPILIGIGYKDFIQDDSLRRRDYTYPTALPEDTFPISGGGDKFLSFIEKELIPFIDNHYRTDTTNRTIMGHSLGGYFTLFALKENIRTNSTYFKNYVAASPSLYYYNQYLLKEFTNIAGDNLNKDSVTLYLTVGENEINGMSGDTSEGATEFNSFVKGISETKFSNIKVNAEIFPSYGHMDTPVPTFTKALTLFFKK